ncbi:MAG: potassium-transporting ATPase subunit KdpC [Pirellulales bacterium]
MSDIIISLRLFLLSILVCSAAYPAVMLGFAAVAAPAERVGSLIRADDGTIVGSRLLAQKFTRPEYFWPRPSACDYNASATAGSNLSPTNPKLADRAKEIIGQLALPAGQLVPADLVAASGGGMDPHISLAAAELQVPRVAGARSLPAEAVEKLIHEHTDGPTLVAFGGEPIINVLELNVALDRLTK